MSDDLVKRLRDARRDWPEYGMDRTDAADELERLRAENARLENALVEAMIVPEAFMLSGRPAHMRNDVWEQIQRSVTIARAVIQNKGGE